MNKFLLIGFLSVCGSLGATVYDEFKELVVQCLLEEKDLQELQIFLEQKGSQLPTRGRGEIDICLEPYSIASLFNRCGDHLFKNKVEVYKIIYLYPFRNRETYNGLVNASNRAQKMTGLQWACYSDVKKDKLLKSAVSDCVHQYLKHPDDPHASKIARYALKKKTICIDWYKMDDGLSYGDALDTNENLPDRDEFIELVDNDRWPNPYRDPERKEFMRLLITDLVENDALIQDQLNYYVQSVQYCPPNRSRTSKTVWTTGLQGEQNGSYNTSVIRFMLGLRSSLFPRKDEVFKRIFSRECKVKEDSQSEDEKQLHSLVRASMDNEVLLPLVKEAYTNYSKLYKKKIDTSLIPYDDSQSIADYLAGNKKTAVYEFYSSLYAQKQETEVTPVQRPSTKPKRTAQRTPASLRGQPNKPTEWSSWQKFLMIGVMCCGAYILYRNAATSNGAARTRIN